MSNVLIRLVRLMVPASWRQTVAADLDDEARTGHHGAGWLAAQTLVAGLRLRSTVSVDALTFDVRHAIRSLARARGFALVAALTFALGIGANVAVFSVVDRIVFRPLPYRDVDRLVQVHQLMHARLRVSAAHR